MYRLYSCTASGVVPQAEGSPTPRPAAGQWCPPHPQQTLLHTGALQPSCLSPASTRTPMTIKHTQVHGRCRVHAQDNQTHISTWMLQGTLVLSDCSCVDKLTPRGSGGGGGAVRVRATSTPTEVTRRLCRHTVLATRPRNGSALLALLHPALMHARTDGGIISCTNRQSHGLECVCTNVSGGRH